MMGSSYRGAILAAGRGARMAPFSERYAKPLLPICGRPMLEHQIDIMRDIGIRDIVVLIGHKGYEIVKALGDGSRLGVSLTYVEQTSALGIGHAVGRLEPHLQHPFLLFLGDIYFVPTDLSIMFRLFEQQGGGGVLATRDESDPEAVRRNFALTLSPDGYVTRVIEKPRHAPNRKKGVGIYLFDLTVFDAIRRTPRTALRDEYELTDAIQVMIDDGNKVRPADVIEEDINLTTPGDLLRCNLRHAAKLPSYARVGEGCAIHPGAVISNCFIGAGARIDHPIRLENSVVFQGTRVETRADLDRVIITQEGVVDCRHLVGRDELVLTENVGAGL